MFNFTNASNKLIADARKAGMKDEDIALALTGVVSGIHQVITDAQNAASIDAAAQAEHEATVADTLRAETAAETAA